MNKEGLIIWTIFPTIIYVLLIVAIKKNRRISKITKNYLYAVCFIVYLGWILVLYLSEFNII